MGNAIFSVRVYVCKRGGGEEERISFSVSARVRTNVRSKCTTESEMFFDGVWSCSLIFIKKFLLSQDYVHAFTLLF